MGKTRSLRRAIERDPERWIVRWPFGRGPQIHPVDRNAAPWTPRRLYRTWGHYGSYGGFVKHTIARLGLRGLQSPAADAGPPDAAAKPVEHTGENAGSIPDTGHTFSWALTLYEQGCRRFQVALRQLAE